MGLLDSILGKNKSNNTAEKRATAKSANAAITLENKAIRQFAQGLIDVKDIIAPSAIEVNFKHVLIGSKFFRSYFAIDYPNTAFPNWLAPLITFEYPVDISTFYYPRETVEILERLKQKIAEMRATINLEVDAGRPPDPVLRVKLRDAEQLQDQLASGSERFFQYGMYLTIHSENLEELEKIAKNLESTMASIGVIIKVATLQQEECFQTTLPYGWDKINQTRNLDTTSIATTFPFVSADLTMEKGVLYGVNLHNRSLVIFDRFSLPNANAVVFATSGAGKSFAIKLEAVRSLMLGVEVIVIDPEREFEKLCAAIGGEYISFSQDGAQKLNPFELSGLFSKDEDELRFKILTLSGLIRMMLGGNLNAEEAAILDRALILTYKEKGITPDPATHSRKAPLLEDLYKILNSMAEEEAHSMAIRLEKFVRGSASGVFDQHSNVNLRNTFTVFSIRDLVEDLRPMAMYVMLDYIWTRVKKDKRKRLLIIDEAWLMMQYPDAARFVYSIAKRARKYALGLSVISQDVSDFIESEYGKAVVSNAAMQVLLKQSPTVIDKLQTVFYLTEGEKQFLLSAGVGEGIFFAGANHVAIQILASEVEYNLITTNPNDLLPQAKPAEMQANPAKPEDLFQKQVVQEEAPTEGQTQAPVTTSVQEVPQPQAAVAAAPMSSQLPVQPAAPIAPVVPAAPVAPAVAPAGVSSAEDKLDITNQ